MTLAVGRDLESASGLSNKEKLVKISSKNCDLIFPLI